MFEWILYRIDPQTVFLVIVFLLSFILINISLSRVLHDNKAAAGIAAFLVSLGITYGIWNYDLDITGFIYNLGISGDTLYYAMAILIIIKIILIIYFFGFSTFLLAIGGLLTVLSYWAYERQNLLITGLILMLIGLIIIWIKRKKKSK